MSRCAQAVQLDLEIPGHLCCLQRDLEPRVECEEEDLFGVSVPPVCVHGGHDAFSFPVCVTLALSGHFWPVLGLVSG